MAVSNLPKHPPMPRRFLFLQGPHGHFFAQLAAALGEAGHSVVSIGSNRGDQHYWPHRDSYHRFDAPQAAWRNYLSGFMARHRITDLVVYGDTRPLHRIARIEAEKRAIRIHCFEEGYLRPYWITYERGGSNGNSVLMSLPRQVYETSDATEPGDRAGQSGRWGALWHHTWYGCIYHANILFLNRSYPHFESHRESSVLREWLLHCKRLALMPARMIERRIKTRRLLGRGRPFHVFMLQLPHDASVTHHGQISNWQNLLADVIGGFSKGAPGHHLLVFKSHPLDDEREPLARLIVQTAKTFGVQNRVMVIPAGKLGALLDHATSALTVNSTAGQQALFRGMPLKAYGRAIYGRPELVSDQATADFFADPKAPDQRAYQNFRNYLLATSQIKGDFYTRAGRAAAIRNVIDRVCAADGPYATTQARSGEPATNPMVVSP